MSYFSKRFVGACPQFALNGLGLTLEFNLSLEKSVCSIPSGERKLGSCGENRHRNRHSRLR